MYNGIIVFNKRQGITSQKAITEIKYALKDQGIDIKKIGHAGTLDPLATGVLIVLINNATKLSDYLLNDIKSYKAKILLGESYDTEDITGTLLNKMVVNNVDKNKIDQVLSSLIGETEQVPPMYSAVKINGQKLYEIARKGETVERKSRTIKILNLERTSEIEEIEDKVYFDFVSKVSKGTYIRTLCTRIGECLGCYASMAELVRISSGNFLLDNSSTIDDIKEGKFKIINMVEAIDLEKINLDDNTFNDVKNGKMITLNSKEALVALVYNKQLVAIYERDNQEYKAKRVWN